MRGQKQKKGAKRAGVVQVVRTHPPPIRAQISHRQRLRFLCLTAGSQSVTFANLLDCMLVATSATTAVDIFDQVKVNFVEMWATGVNNVSLLTVACGFTGGTTGVAGDGRIISDTSMNSEPAHIKAKPLPSSAAGQWQISNGLVAFTLFDCPAAAIIDVDCSFRNADIAPVSSAVAPVGATAGQFYYRGLDGQATASTKFQPLAHLVI